MKRRAFIPSSPTPLEERITPSHSGLAGGVATPHALTQSQKLVLSGFVLGRDTAIGSVHLLQASGGTISPLGTVSLNGYLVIPTTGPANRPASGLVTLSNAKGTVTVALKGTVTVTKASFTFASGTLTYTIVSGTKADRGATGTGPVLYGPGPVFLPGRFLLDFGNYPPPP
jgi:hypothetical protein